MRILVLLALASLAACSASPPQSASEQPAVAAPAAAPAPAAVAAPAPAVAPAAAAAENAESEFKAPAGYKARVENGNRLYCRKTTVLGSRFAKETCMTEAQLRDFERSNEGMRQNKDQTSRVCAGGGACQAN